MFPLLPADDRGKDAVRLASIQFHDPLYDLLTALRRDSSAALRAMTVTNARVENAEEVVDLGNRANGRAWIASSGLLGDRNGRAQSSDVIHIGFGHLPKKLTGITGEAFNVSSLPFCVQRVKRQGTFPRTADTGHADQLMPRK